MSNEKKECPSCAMEIDKDAESCPICGYEFPASTSLMKWLALLLALAFLLMIFL